MRNHFLRTVSPSIVTSDLLFHVDAGNSLSYPGTGTSWFDIGSAARTGTITNSPSFQTSPRGYFLFNGTDEYVTYGSTSSATALNLNGTDFTISWVAFSDNSGGHQFGRVVEKATFGNATGGYSIFRNTATNSYIFAVNGITTATSPGSSIVNNAWEHWSATYTLNGSGGTDITIYKNGATIGTPWTVATTAPATDATLNIGNWYTPAGRPWKGGIASVSIYSRALESNEIAQNFNFYNKYFNF